MRSRAALIGVVGWLAVSLGAGSASASWTEPVVVAAAPQNPGGAPFYLDSDASRRSTLAWLGVDTFVRRIQADGSLLAPFQIVTPPSVADSGFRFALGSNGAGAVTFPADDLDFFAPFTARSVAADGTLGPATEFGEGPADNLAVDGSGNAAVAWLNIEDDTWAVEAREMAPDGSLGSTITLRTIPVDEISSLGPVRVGYADDGTLVVVWEWEDENGVQLVQARRVSPAGTLGALLDLSSASTPTGFVLGEPVLAPSPGNSMTVMWQRRSSGNWVLEARTIASNGTLGATRSIASATYPDSFVGGFADIAVSASGNATAVWDRNLGDFDNPAVIVETRKIAPDGTLGAIQTLSTVEADFVYNLAVEVDHAEAATAAWAYRSFPGSAIRARRINANGSLDAIQALQSGSEVRDFAEVDIPVLSVDPNGVATVAWLVRTDFDPNHIRMSRFEPGPETVITSGPSAATSDASPSFDFTSPDATNGFECRLGTAGAFASCTSPRAFSGLEDGAYTFAVRAMDATYTDASPATSSFAVDTADPDTAIGRVTVKHRPGKATIRFTGSDSAPAGPPNFRCSIDGAAFKSCRSPKVYRGLDPGRHKVRVGAVDAAGNEDSTPARTRLKIRRR